MKAAINKAQMDASIRKNSGSKRAMHSVAGPILGQPQNKMLDSCIGNRTTGSKLTTLIGKK